MKGTRTLPGQRPGNRRQTIGRFFTKIWKIPDYNSADSLPILCRWSPDVLSVSARGSHGARPTFGGVSVVEASPATRRSWDERRTARKPADMKIFSLLHQLPHHPTRRRKSMYRKKQADEKMFLILPQHKNSEVETQAGECIFATPLHWPVWSQSKKGKQIHCVGEEDGESVLGSLSIANMRRSWQSCTATESKMWSWPISWNLLLQPLMLGQSDLLAVHWLSLSKHARIQRIAMVAPVLVQSSFESIQWWSRHYLTW